MYVRMFDTWEVYETKANLSESHLLRSRHPFPLNNSFCPGWKGSIHPVEQDIIIGKYLSKNTIKQNIKSTLKIMF